MSNKRIVLMNHTNMQGHHFGCARVMRLLEDGLTSRGAVITANLDGKQNWMKSPEALAALEACDAIVVNGEGTLHHGRKKASWLMEIARHPVTKDKELALVNALFQDNPDSWIPLVQGFKHLYARDARSAKELSRMAGRDVKSFGDLSTSAGALPELGNREGIVIGDSVKNELTRALYNFADELAKSEPVRILPLTISLREENPYRHPLHRAIKRFDYARRQKKQEATYPLLRYLDSEEAYVDVLRRSRLSVTGRFHGVCLNLVTGTPFACLSSNSWKIEALFEDAGVDRRRMLTAKDLTPEVIQKQDWSYSEQEKANIAAFLERSVAGANAMYDAIVG